MTQVITADLIGSGTQVTLIDSERGYVLPGVTVASTATFGVGILGTGGRHKLTVDGTVFGDSYAVQLGGYGINDFASTLTVGLRGIAIGGGIAVEMRVSGARITNLGEIHGGTHGVRVTDTGTFSASVTNAGLIEGTGGYGLYHESATSGMQVLNSGTIIGGLAAFFSSDSYLVADSLRNRGLMLGDIQLGGGADRYDGRGGSVEGTIYGGSGSDLFIPGLSEEVFDGGAGIDTLDFSAQRALIVSLAVAYSGTRTAEGDLYSGIENVIGSNAGDDRIDGDDVGNVLWGMGGSDTLAAALGNDTLIGGDGADRLTGGAGDDEFRYQNISEAGDFISDFGTGGDSDVIVISAFGFGAGLVAGVLLPGRFVSRADNLAQDANDRFIFNTTDKTLWFDADGNNAGAAILLADLQQSATVVAADILIA